MQSVILVVKYFALEQEVFNDLAIPFNKKKVIRLLVLSLIFLMATSYYFINGGIKIGDRIYYSFTLYLVSGIGALVVAAAMIFFVKRLIDKRPALIISDEGITDNTNNLSLGEVAWGDITGISVVTVYGQKLIFLIVNNAEVYIDRQQSKIKRNLMSVNLKTYGSPISIATNVLDISLEQLLGILEERIAK